MMCNFNNSNKDIAVFCVKHNILYTLYDFVSLATCCPSIAMLVLYTTVFCVGTYVHVYIYT